MNRDKQIKSSNWLTKGYSQEELGKMKAEAIKEAKIEEMAKIMCVSDSDCIMCAAQSPCQLKNFAKRLYENGYRKASEVVAEIFEKLKVDLKGYIGLNYLDELKKKYTEDEG